MDAVPSPGLWPPPMGGEVCMREFVTIFCNPWMGSAADDRESTSLSAGGKLRTSRHVEDVAIENHVANPLPSFQPSTVRDENLKESPPGRPSLPRQRCLPLASRPVPSHFQRNTGPAPRR